MEIVQRRLQQVRVVGVVTREGHEGGSGGRAPSGRGALRETLGGGAEHRARRSAPTARSAPPLKRGGPVSHIWQILTAVLGTLDFPNRGHANPDELPRGAEQTADAFAIRGGAARTRPSTPVRARREDDVLGADAHEVRRARPARRDASPVRARLPTRPRASDRDAPVSDAARGRSVRVALKEWGAVVAALAAGEQTVIFRKGGLRDGGKGFKLQADAFALFPTAYHPNERPEERRAFLDAPVPGHA